MADKYYISQHIKNVGNRVGSSCLAESEGASDFEELFEV
jgi:hypothetical protein